MAKKPIKSTVKAKPAKKAVKKTPINTKLKTLHTELVNLVKEINEDGLTFLIAQAKTIIHNIKIDKLNKEKTSGNSKEIKIIEEGNKTNFIIQIGNERKFFSRDDFRGLVKVAQSGESVALLGTQMFNWLMKERKDFLIDNNIQKGNDPRLLEMIKTVRSKYKVKK